ncbi:universal stress protein [Corynebacterium mendelii]|uniref:Universal stress protein n=1 Tax=Corynebacterium mendelii TaxID=2765362 RepID=A0A939E291_9CORY|nr:universal stress protein [Corynebacterium mendelii]MBN9644356.1 universal stress protein [Corynebacterium mendelii]
MNASTDHPPASPARRLRVLVACPPGDHSDAAYTGAAWIARTTDTDIRVAVAFARPWPSLAAAKLQGSYDSWRDGEAAKAKGRVLAALRRAGVSAGCLNHTPVVFCDGPAAAPLITQEATEFRADLILLGPEGSAKKGRFSASTTADALLHTSPAALGLVPRKAKLSKKGVTRLTLAVTSPEEFDPETLSRATAIAQAARLPLRIIAVTPQGLTGPTEGDVPPQLQDAISHGWREHTLAFLDRLSDTVFDTAPGIQCTTGIGAGHGFSGALESVSWKKGDLLVVGSTPTGAFERVFIGSVASEILKTSPVPVLVLPAGGA